MIRYWPHGNMVWAKRWLSRRMPRAVGRANGSIGIQFPQFWGQVVRYTIGDPNASALNVSVDQEGDSAKVIVDARAANGAYLNGYTLNGNIVNPDGISSTDRVAANRTRSL